MQRVPQNLLKEYVQSQNFTSTADIMQAMKEMFRDADGLVPFLFLLQFINCEV